MAVEIGFGLVWEIAAEGDGLASAAVGLDFDSSPCAIIPLGNQERISRQPETMSRPSLSDGSFAMGVAASTGGTSSRGGLLCIKRRFSRYVSEKSEPAKLNRRTTRPKSDGILVLAAKRQRPRNVCSAWLSSRPA